MNLDHNNLSPLAHFYFRNEVEIHEFLPRFQNLLYDYKQHINTEKTQVQKYPYQLMSDFSDELKNHDFSNKGFLNYIEKAIELHNFGHKGALKYALKVIGKMKVPNKEKDVVFAHIKHIVCMLLKCLVCVGSGYLVVYP